MIRTQAIISTFRPRATNTSATLLCAVLLTSVGIVQAAQEAHEHGKGELNVIVERVSVGLELRVPGVDVVGFERKASTKEEKAAVITALEDFSNPGHLFAMTTGAECVVVNAAASLDDEHAAGGDAEKHTHNHAGKQEHDRLHSELRAEYFFECASPALLKQIVVNVFDLLSVKALRTTVVTEKRQTVVELTPAARSIDFAP